MRHDGSAAPPLRAALRRPVPLLIGLFLITWFRTAWVCDDAYITFRTIDNLWHGFGAVFNPAERVQAYTHPLWMFLVAAGYGLTREPYFTSLALSALCSVAALILLSRSVSRNTTVAALTLLALDLSRAFVDYSSSGLENPLTHLLLVAFVATWLRWEAEHTPRAAMAITMLSGLIVLTRPDAALLVAPSLVAMWIRAGLKQTIRSAAGLLPLVVWEAFSLFYYGSPVPNTAIAKLETGIPARLLIPHGLGYLLDSATRDPLTPMIITGGILATATRRRARLRPLGLGVLLHLAFVIRIGGDFMSGRFLSAPFLVSASILAATPFHTIVRSRIGTLLAALAIVLAGAAGDRPVTLSGPDYGTGAPPGEATGITDERSQYYPTTGLFRAEHPLEPPNHPWVADGKRLRDEARIHGRQVVLRFAVGMVGFYAGPDVHIVDVHALTDPLLARLPCNQCEGGFRIGHFARWIPGGYLDTLRSGENHITHEALARYYDKLWQVTRGKLWDAARIRTLIAFNLGRYDPWLNAYRDPSRQHVALSLVDRPRPPDRTRWDARGNVLMSRRGVVVTLGTPCHAPSLEVSLDRNDDYRLTFILRGRPVGTAVVSRIETTRRGLATRQVPVPVPARDAGFDTIEVVPLDGDFAWSLGHLHLPPAAGCPMPDAAGATRELSATDAGQ